MARVTLASLNRENAELRALLAETVRDLREANERATLLEGRIAANYPPTPVAPPLPNNTGVIAARLAKLMKSTVRFNQNRFEYFEPSVRAWYDVPMNKVAFVTN